MIPERELRAVLRAELIERGFDVAATTDLLHARRLRLDARGPVRAAILDEEAARAATLVEIVLGKLARPPVLLLARSTVEPPPGPWTRMLRRPVSVGTIAEAVAALAR